MPEPKPHAAAHRWNPVPTVWLEAQRRERDLVRSELYKIKGLFPLLMQVRNGGQWTLDERRLLAGQIRALGTISPYVVVLFLPGSFFALPVLAWWLDRRRHLRDAGASPT